MTETIKQRISDYNDILKSATPHEVIRFFLDTFEDKITFATSLGAEDQVITEMISGIDPSASIFTLDTGRLFPESYDLLDVTQRRYKISIDVKFPDTEAVESMVKEKGINLFYESVENRKMCCDVRKIEPLRKALKGAEAWFTGLRRDQSITRKDAALVEWDKANKLIKVNPLIDWSEEEVWNYIEEKNIPFNKLHNQGFPSIGCQPCTRAIQPGEDIRSGRWWWETPAQKECGLHKR